MKLKTFLITFLLPFLSYAFCSNANAQLSLTGVQRLTNPCKQFEKIEFDVAMTIPSGLNPYDEADIILTGEFTAPNGKVYLQDGFKYEHYQDDPDIPGKIDRVESGDRWKIRFAAPLPGTWTYRVILTQKQPLTTLVWPSGGITASFSVEASTNKGFIKRYDSKYMRYSNGDVFIPMAFNLSWPTGDITGTPPFDIMPNHIEFIEKMNMLSGEGVNLIKSMLGRNPSINLIGYDNETDKNYYKQFNQNDSWRIDQIFKQAEINGMYLLLCPFVQDNFSDLATTSCNDPVQFHANQWSFLNPFNADLIDHPDLNNIPSDGPGPCNSPYEFYTNEIAKSVTKQLFRYMLARWGYSTSLFALQTMSEADHIGGGPHNDTSPKCYTKPTDLNTLIVGWQNAMYNYITAHDDLDHLVTIDAGVDDNVFTNYMPADFSSYHTYLWYHHGYVGSNGPVQEQLAEYNMINKIWEKNAEHYSINQHPGTCTEYDYVNDPERNRSNKTDTYYYNLHCINWSSVLSGGFSTAAFYYYNGYIMNENLNDLNHFKGISKYVHTLEKYVNESYVSKFNNQNKPAANQEPINLYTLSAPNEHMVYGWMQDTTFGFVNLFNTCYNPNDNNTSCTGNYLFEEICNLPFAPTFASAPNYKTTYNVGSANTNFRYRLTWYDTYSGDPIASSEVIPTTGFVELQFPSGYRSCLTNFHGDAAFDLTCYPSTGWLEDKLSRIQVTKLIGTSEMVLSTAGNQLFFITERGRVGVLYKLNDRWFDVELPTDYAMSAGRGLVFHSTDNAVYYTGTDVGSNGYIYKLSYSNNTWSSAKACPTQYKAARSDSELKVSSSGSTIFYISSDNRVCAIYKSGSTWLNYELSTSAPRVLSGRGLAYDANTGYVYYVGNDGFIYRFICVNNIWTASKVSASQSYMVRADSELELSVSGTTIFYVDQAGDICNLWKNGTVWANGKLYTLPVGKKVDAGTDITYESDALYYIAGSKIGKVFYNGGWQHADIHQPEYCQTLAKNGIIKLEGDKYCFIGDDNYVHYFYYSSALKSGEPTIESEIVENVSNDLTVYPNPASDVIRFTSTVTCEECKLNIFNMQGVKVIDNLVYTPNAPISVASLPDGIYVAKLVSASSTQMVKFVVKK